MSSLSCKIEIKDTFTLFCVCICVQVYTSNVCAYTGVFVYVYVCMCRCVCVSKADNNFWYCSSRALSSCFLRRGLSLGPELSYWQRS